MNNTNRATINPVHPLSLFLPWFIWGLGCLFYFYEFFLQVSPSVMQKELSCAFNITASGFGILGGVYFYSYAGMQIPAGILLDRLGPHRLLTFATFLCAIATFAFAHTNSFTMALSARFCIGFGSAFAVVGTLKLAANWFPAKRFALLTGLMVAVGMSGAVGGEQLLAIMVNHYGWRDSLDYLGYIGLILALLIFLIAKDKPANKNPPKLIKVPFIQQINEVIDSLHLALKNPQLWLVAIYGGLVFMATLTFCGLWGIAYLETKYGINKNIAATLISTVFIGWIVGSPTWGLISDKLGKRKPPMIIGPSVAVICFSALLYLPLLPLFIAGVLLFLFGFFSAGFLPAFSVVKEISCNRNSATSLGFMNMMNMVGVALSQPFIGWLLDKFWQGTLLPNGNRFYTTANYQIAISILPIAILASLLLLPFIKETYCKDNPDS